MYKINLRNNILPDEKSGMALATAVKMLKFVEDPQQAFQWTKFVAAWFVIGLVPPHPWAFFPIFVRSPESLPEQLSNSKKSRYLNN